MLQPRNLKLDLFALALLALVVFLAMALFTFNPADPPSTLVYPPKSDISNACGRWGALAAELLLRTIGLGAYFVVLSIAVLDGLLLARRPIEDQIPRAIGWVMALIGITTFSALALPSFSPGPVIGAGGYLGAAGRGLLEMNFATVGSYVLTISVILAGLLLCTDYLLVRAARLALHVPTKVVTRAGANALRRRGSGQRLPDDLQDGPDTDEDEEDEPSVKIRGKATETEPPKTAKAKNAPATPTKSTAAKPLAETPTPVKKPSKAGPEEEPAAEAPKPTGVAQRLAEALKIKNLNKNDRDEVIEELEAASRSDETFDYELPPIEMLLINEATHPEEHEKEVRQKAKVLEKTFGDFGFKVKVVEIETGPVIAQYEVELEAGLRLSKITSLADDLAIALRVPSVRIVAPIPGKNTVGIEVPNADRQLVRLREVIEETNGKARKMHIPIFLGKDVSGNPMVVDLATLPHLLIAGRTGTGKSVCLNSIILSMLMTRRPDEVRMLMIDPKMVELSPYKRLPHLMHPVVTDMRKAEAILAWAVEKMEERYALLARAGVRHISVYNQLGEEELMDRLKPEDDDQRREIPLNLPYIVIVADEIADLMMTSGKEVEQHIIRLAQKSRAVGIHLVLATQKPTVDVITGLIKSNLPARIAFQVASRTDSRVVLDEMGADKLLGNGDMLFLWPGTSTLLRGQGTYLSDDEITPRVVDFVGTTEPQFVKELVQLKAAGPDGDTAAKLKSRDELYEAALDIVVREGRGSVSLLQRTLGIGYGRAARLVDYMAEDGIVGEYNGSQAREVMITLEQLAAMLGGEPPPPTPPPVARGKRNRILPEASVKVIEPEEVIPRLSIASEAEEEEADEAEEWKEEETEEVEDSGGVEASDEEESEEEDSDEIEGEEAEDDEEEFEEDGEDEGEVDAEDESDEEEAVEEEDAEDDLEEDEEEPVPVRRPRGRAPNTTPA